MPRANTLIHMAAHTYARIASVMSAHPLRVWGRSWGGSGFGESCADAPQGAIPTGLKFAVALFIEADAPQHRIGFAKFSQKVGCSGHKVGVLGHRRFGRALDVCNGP